MQSLLAFGLPAQVESEIEEVVRLCWRGGGYIGGTAQGNAPGAPPANLEAFFRSFLRVGGGA